MRPPLDPKVLLIMEATFMSYKMFISEFPIWKLQQSLFVLKLELNILGQLDLSELNIIPQLNKLSFQCQEIAVITQSSVLMALSTALKVFRAKTCIDQP